MLVARASDPNQLNSSVSVQKAKIGLLKLKLKNGDKGIQFSYFIDLFCFTFELYCMVHVYVRVLCG